MFENFQLGWRRMPKHPSPGETPMTFLKGIQHWLQSSRHGKGMLAALLVIDYLLRQRPPVAYTQAAITWRYCYSVDLCGEQVAAARTR
jgi:hypothetical protein